MITHAPRTRFAATCRIVLLSVFGAVSSPAVDAPPPPPGVVIDHRPASAGIFIGSPSLAILPDGRYVAPHDEFGPGKRVGKDELAKRGNITITIPKAVVA